MSCVRLYSRPSHIRRQRDRAPFGYAKSSDMQKYKYHQNVMNIVIILQLLCLYAGTFEMTASLGAPWSPHAIIHFTPRKTMAVAGISHAQPTPLHCLETLDTERKVVSFHQASHAPHTLHSMAYTKEQTPLLVHFQTYQY